MKKKCLACLGTVSTLKFNKSSLTKDGYQNWCRKCQAKKYDQYRRSNPEKINAKWKRYYERNKERMIARTREYEKNNPSKIKRKIWNRNSMMTRYGITEEYYKKLREEQKQKCAMCNTKFEEKTVHIDHSHQTGKIRGILCVPCNMGLGFIEKEGFLKKAQAYIRKTEK